MGELSGYYGGDGNQKMLDNTKVGQLWIKFHTSFTANVWRAVSIR